jgi:KipI family sensor histidine kinase inhibitor
MTRKLLSAASSLSDTSAHRRENREHQISVRYDGQDLSDVAERTGMSVKDVIAAHTSQTYTVDLLGFVPGFAYLSELPVSLQLPRRGEPRPRVAAGSVAIAGSQTAVYPLDTPGGWHLLGRTEIKLFDPTRSPPALLEPGDSVRFVRS